jgi:multidrug efflux pump subunit AcrA (membrane-fusion protein)
MVRQVRGLGTLVRGQDSANSIARITLPEVMAQEVRVDQRATVETRKGRIGNGHVSRISPSPSNDTRTVDIVLDSTSPQGFTTPGPEVVDASIDIEKLDNILYAGRPVHGAADTSISLFKIINDGKEAVKVKVKLGRASVNTIEVVDGLQEGDKIILSDMSNWDNVDRIQIK